MRDKTRQICYIMLSHAVLEVAQEVQLKLMSDQGGVR